MRTVTKQEEQVSYRDRSVLVKEDGGRKWIFPSKPSGPYYKARTYLSWVYFGIFIVLPFIEYQGNPLFLLNFPERKIILFGSIFTPNDFYLLMLLFVSLVVFIVSFTVVFGRIFCGWACPQTIFMEMLFRKIEYWIEGDAEAQKRLNKAPWNREKYFKKISKHLIFWGLSFLIANLFLSYIIGVKELWKIIREPISEHIVGFISLVFFTTVFYLVFAFLRELACVVVCPYGRLQGVLLDKSSIVVAYDYVRGEPRGKKSKNNEALGDCVDCGLCVRVCPTGIDIRNGTQLECVNCTACIDACNNIMQKIGKPKGLIRYTSEAALEGKQKGFFTPRVAFYTTFLTALLGVTMYLLSQKTDIDVLLMRSQGQLYQELNGSIANLYTLKVQNKLEVERELSYEIAESGGKIVWVNGEAHHIDKEGELNRVMFISFPAGSVKGTKEIHLLVKEKQEVIKRIKTKFYGPF